MLYEQFVGAVLVAAASNTITLDHHPPCLTDLSVRPGKYDNNVYVICSKHIQVRFKFVFYCVY